MYRMTSVMPGSSAGALCADTYWLVVLVALASLEVWCGSAPLIVITLVLLFVVCVQLQVASVRS